MKFASCAVVICGIVVLVLLGCRTTKREAETASLQPVRLSEGDYLSSAYIDTLMRTRSPLAAGKTGELNNMSVWRKDKRLLLTPGYNFHEAGTDYAFQNDGSLSPASPENASSESARNLSVSVLDDRTLQFGLDDLKPASYIFVKNKTDYVSKVALAGKYSDGRGRAYEFTEDGWAVFPDRKFRFEIGLDHVLNGFDYFMDMDGHKMWAFKRKGAEIQIFPTSDADGPEQISSDHPSLSLRQVR